MVYLSNTWAWIGLLRPHLVDDGGLADALDGLEHRHLRLDALQLRELVRLVRRVHLGHGGA